MELYAVVIPYLWKLGNLRGIPLIYETWFNIIKLNSYIIVLHIGSFFLMFTMHKLWIIELIAGNLFILCQICDEQGLVLVVEPTLVLRISWVQFLSD